MAYDYFEKGCNLEEPDSCLHQGLLLITKNDRPELQHDVVKGMQLLDKACTGKNANACYYLSGMYIMGVRKTDAVSNPDKSKTDEFEVPKSMKKAFQYALDGCTLGNIYSCANLSQMYAKGDGECLSVLKKNPELAEKYKGIALEMQKDVQDNKTLSFQEGLPAT
ncbi:hypothetical protein NQ314_003141 [Rhamnusium bicolor]|uniref:Uncharacterized protein n=1 Tax=Rhamnusium bicolor TaxID=1586634 RepID=A0AAV8ZN54_9CUCU|nr:hypothetical protein NQ314_003141 [Rhamnusium bicolor]